MGKKKWGFKDPIKCLIFWLSQVSLGQTCLKFSPIQVLNSVCFGSGNHLHVI